MTDDLKTLCSHLSLDERVELRDYLSDSIIATRGGAKKSPMRCSHLLGIMAKVMGEEYISYDSRQPSLVWARTMVAWQMIREGYSYYEIGRQMKKDHATISYMKAKMKGAIAFPKGYRDILEIWDNFQKLI